MSNLLLITLLLPLAGAIAMIFLASKGRQTVRLAALGVTGVTFAAAAKLLRDFPADGVETPFGLTSIPGLELYNLKLMIGLDGVGLWLFGLSALLAVTSVLISWEAVEDRPALFYGMLLLLEFGCLGVFSAQDLLLFYVFFEFTLIPLFFLIGIWGSEERRYAAVKFFLFTLAGSVLTFLGLLSIVLWVWSAGGEQGQLVTGLAELTEALAKHPMPPERQYWVFLALFAGFAIKVPLFPFHSWLPLAHVQAPAAGSVFLAGVLLKMGVYGFLRFSVPMLPDAAAQCMPWLLWLSVIGIVYGALVALAQRDMKRLIAYSSVSHLGFCTLGLFAFNRLGVSGAALQLINHGLSTGGLFALIGMIYERYHTREIGRFGGLSRRLPILACCMLVFTFSSIGLPGLNGFAGELLILIGMFQRGFAEETSIWQFQYQAIAVISVSGVVLGAWYMLWLVQRVFFGPLKEPHGAAGHGEASKASPADSHGHAIGDLNARELAALAPLLVFVVWIGLQPQFFLRRMTPTLNSLTASVVDPLHEQSAPGEKTAGLAAASVEGSR